MMHCELSSMAVELVCVAVQASLHQAERLANGRGHRNGSHVRFQHFYGTTEAMRKATLQFDIGARSLDPHTSQTVSE